MYGYAKWSSGGYSHLPHEFRLMDEIKLERGPF